MFLGRTVVEVSEFFVEVNVRPKVLGRRRRESHSDRLPPVVEFHGLRSRSDTTLLGGRGRERRRGPPLSRSTPVFPLIELGI